RRARPGCHRREKRALCGNYAVLAAGEARLAFFHERGHPLVGVLAREESSELVDLALQVLDVVALERVVRRALDRRERGRALGRGLLGSPARVVDGGIVYLVAQPDPQGLLGVDDTPREDQVLRDAEPADAREPLRPAPAGNDPEVDLRLAELRAGRRVAQVA